MMYAFTIIMIQLLVPSSAVKGTIFHFLDEANVTTAQYNIPVSKKELFLMFFPCFYVG